MCADVKQECLDALALSDEVITGDGLSEFEMRRLEHHHASCEPCRKRHEHRMSLWDALGSELVGVRSRVLETTRRRGAAAGGLVSERRRWLPVISWGLSRRVALAASFAVALVLGMYAGPLLRGHFRPTPLYMPGIEVAPEPSTPGSLRPAGAVWMAPGRRPIFVRRNGDEVEILPLLTAEEMARRDAYRRVRDAAASWQEVPLY